MQKKSEFICNFFCFPICMECSFSPYFISSPACGCACSAWALGASWALPGLVCRAGWFRAVPPMLTSSDPRSSVLIHPSPALSSLPSSTTLITTVCKRQTVQHWLVTIYTMGFKPEFRNHACLLGSLVCTPPFNPWCYPHLLCQKMTFKKKQLFPKKN